MVRLAPQSSPTPSVASRPTLWQLYRSLRPAEEPSNPIRSGIAALRQGSESAATAGLLGWLDGRFGLDLQGKYPLDGILAAAGLSASLFSTGPEGYSQEYRNIGSSALSVFAYRKMKAWEESRKTLPNVLHSGNTEDPILRAGRSAGL